MSFSDYAGLQASIADWMARSDLTAVVPDFIDLFEAEANRRLRVRQMEVTISTTPSSGGVFPLPTDYVGWRTVTWTSNGATKSLEYVSPSELVYLYPDQAAGIPETFTVTGTTDQVGQVQIMPASGSAVGFSYFQKITSLSTVLGSTTNWLLNAHPNIYLYGSLTEACHYTKDFDNALAWEQKRDGLFREIKHLDDRTRGPSSIRVKGPTP